MEINIEVPYEKDSSAYKKYLRNAKIYVSTIFHIHYARLSYKRFLDRERHPWDVSADVHSFFVAVGNLKYHLKLLRSAVNDETLSKLIDKQNKWLYKCTEMRDEIEHVYDGRLDGLTKNEKPMTEPNELGKVVGMVFNFGGLKVDLEESHISLVGFSNALDLWNGKKCKFPKPE